MPRGVPGTLDVTSAGSASPLNQPSRYSPDAQNCPSGLPFDAQPTDITPVTGPLSATAGAGAGTGVRASGAWAKADPATTNAVPRASIIRVIMASSPSTSTGRTRLAPAPPGEGSVVAH